MSAATARPLAVRIAEEEARLARRQMAFSSAQRRLYRVTVPTVPDRDAAMLKADDAARQTQCMDAALARYAAAQQHADRMWSHVITSRVRLGGLYILEGLEAT